MKITGKIARITSDVEVIINRGGRHGVRDGQVFGVTSPPENVSDPDDAESIGRFSRVKAKLIVVQHSEAFCVARTFETAQVLPPAGIWPASNPLQPPKYETRKVRINRNGKSYVPGVDIEVGDSVTLLGKSESGDFPSVILE
ncbi:hypothetical protein [Nocardioides sp. GY 10127]|uniref:hypothetical protein n=1 Tax=Nocardioides sp. GY 10127 TaxID=2569762 RepID=UPI0010A83316|nr:hypothetical protein [Nocardioides sp. GY 10127]TIC80701.1 hypothetical protein E8D37_12475 [Nocardioides sp. GY 10127]